MRARVKDVYRCPYTGAPLELEITEQAGDDVTAGALVAADRRYPIVDGIPHLISEADENMTDEEERELAYYQATSDSYDAVMDWLFRSFFEDEDRVREGMVDLLRVGEGDRVLETGCGTCRDSVRIARRLGPGGELFLQDLSPAMVTVGRERMRREGAAAELPETEYLVGNATTLPFADDTFDAAFHFGGLNLFSDRAAALAEMARVVRTGGRVVVGDESLAPWHRETTYGRILLNSNRLYRYEVPIELVPESAREVALRWLIGNAFYLIEFTVGEGPPAVDLDLPIMGRRGGTHRSRYYGNLEGVTVEAKELAERSADASGLSLHDWLDRAVREQALREGGGSG